MNNPEAIPLRGDRALQHGQDDKLGYRDVAERIAVSLVDHASDGGLVVGIEGAWGSGKSSLLALIEEALGELPKGQRPTVINFRPWLVGNRDALLANLFESISKALADYRLSAGDATQATIAKVKETGEALRKFTAAIGKVGTVVEAAGDAADYKPAKFFGAILSGSREATKDKAAALPLDKLKEKLVNSLRELGHRFIITIDDIDRLEPAEVLEVLRLARSVADFPNVVYVLCYDSEILAHSVKRAAQVADGHAYLEKIVQLTVMVPKPEPFQLRQWFSDELKAIASTKSDEELSRLKSVFNYEGGRQLKTPRSVVRTLDSLRFFWPPLREAEADLADLVWLMFIKDGNPALYRWIENYCATAAVLSLGTASVEEYERVEQVTKLLETVGESYFDDHMYRHYFAEQLAGLSVDFAQDGNKFKLHQNVNERDRDKAIRDRRLASPDHYRLYFALSGPSHALTQQDLDELWLAADGGVKDTGELILKWHKEAPDGSLGKADLLLERMKSFGPEILNATRSKHFLAAFSNVLDDAYRLRPFDLHWFNAIWDRAERLVPILMSRLAEDERSLILKSIFSEGTAIGWLTSLFRSEIFSQGRHGDQRKQEAEWIFKPTELDTISELMASRYRAMSLQNVLASVDPVNLLYAWQQGGDEDGARKLIAASGDTDEGFIETLESLSNLMTWRDLQNFLDIEITKARTLAIATAVEGIPTADLAKRLAVNFNWLSGS
jgi:KAP family P-loop domain